MQFSSHEEFHGAPSIASTSILCQFWVCSSHYSIALVLIFKAYSLSSRFRNILFIFQLMKSTPSQMRNHFVQKNQQVDDCNSTWIQENSQSSVCLNRSPSNSLSICTVLQINYIPNVTIEMG